MTLTTAQRAMYGRMGAAIARARHDPAALTAEARKRFLSRFEAQARELHPNADEPEIARVAAELKRAHFLRMAAASSRARINKAASATNADGPEVSGAGHDTPTRAS